MLNLKKRFKNIYFIFGVLAVLFLLAGQLGIDFLSQLDSSINTVMLLVALAGVTADPTTPGICDKDDNDNVAG